MKLSIVVLAASIALTTASSSCVAHSRVERNRAIAENQRAEAELARAEAAKARAQAEAIRSRETTEEYIECSTAPTAPAAEAEAVPPCPSEGCVWIAGCHTWRGGRWVWSAGRWCAPPRVGARWLVGHWQARGRGFVWVEARWE